MNYLPCILRSILFLLLPSLILLVFVEFPIHISSQPKSVTAHTGDGFRIDFDNDHSGTSFALGDEVLGSDAGQPQFNDHFIDGNPVPSSSGEDVDNGGTIDGASVAGRKKNHFEIEHPLCSGDSLDFCLNSSDVVGFRLEYFDAEANGDFGGSYFFPGTTNTSEADIIIGDCDIPVMYTYIPAILM